MINKKLPKIGFIPPFDTFGDVLPSVEIAKKYRKIGGEAVFFSEGGQYEKIAKENGFKVIKVREKHPEEMAEKRQKLDDTYYYNENVKEKELFDLLEDFQKHDTGLIELMSEAFKKENVKLIVTNYFYTPLVAAHKVDIPLLFITSGVMTRLYYESRYATFPDSHENFLTKLIPDFIKNRLTNWYMLKCKWLVKGFNELAEKYKIDKINYFVDFFSGDYTLIADELEFLNLRSNSEFPKKNFTGFIKPEDINVKSDSKNISEVYDHINKPGKSILVSLGSSGSKKIFLKILNALNKTEYNVVGIYTSILSKDELPEVDDNILLKKFVSSIKDVNKKVDLAIIHGGRGTVYTAAYAGRPVLGIPMQTEQQFNLDNLMRNNSGLMVSKKFFSEKKLLEAIEKIFTDYKYFQKNAKKLSKTLPEPKGAENAAKRIAEILSNNS